MNRLSTETSPYLLQHAQNPVDWYPWCAEAFERAQEENKPVLISIGYSSCHWCHVMEHESFEDEEVAKLMNALYVNIKVDREEHPDVDHMYMDAVQAMTGSGGWPLNVFVTPEKKPFYGGTYFPPKRVHQRASWKEVLINVSQYFSQNREEVEKQAGQLISHLKSISNIGQESNSDTKNSSAPDVESWIHKLLSHADKTHGGFGLAPKFPSTHSLSFLLDYASLHAHEESLSHVKLSLNKMMEGGLYDQLGGGFARYSTDKYWFAPHFEKMLYDNALLIELYAKAYASTKDERYKLVIEQTVQWLTREMTIETPDGIGFYSAQDADSEGVEGKYYTWTYDELKTLLGDDVHLFAKYFNCKEEGNWEHTNILFLTDASQEALKDADKAIIQHAKELLLKIRDNRIKPLTDDKILLGWNALMNKALTFSYLHTGNTLYLALAEKNIQFLLANFKGVEGQYFHTYKNEKAKITAYADDLAFLASALYQLFLATANPFYKTEMDKVLIFLEMEYKSQDSLLYNFTSRKALEIEINKRDIYDGATPSPNSVLCGLFQRLGIAYPEQEYTPKSEAMLQYMLQFCQNHPSSFSLWCGIWQLQQAELIEVKIIGVKAKEVYAKWHTKTYKPNVFYKTEQYGQSEGDTDANPKKMQQLQVEVCKNQTCHLPVFSVEEAENLIFC